MLKSAPLPLATALLLLGSSAVAVAHHGPPHEEDEFLNPPARATAAPPRPFSEVALSVSGPLAILTVWLLAARTAKRTTAAHASVTP